MTEKRQRTLEVVIDGNIFPEFARLTRDNNPLHVNEEYARSLGFETTPAQGVLIQSYFEECALMNEWTNDSKNRFRFNMGHSAYPGDRLTFMPDHLNGIDIFGAVNQRGERIATYSEIPSKPIETQDSWEGLVGSFSDAISREDVNKFYELTGIERRERVPYTLLFSLIPSSLLKLASDSNGIPVGTFKKIYSDFHKEPSIGRVDTNVYLIKAQERHGHNVYKFFVTCRDREEEVTSGEVVVTCPVKLELEVAA